ncbi:unnamed protein product [Cochlearia groenlandica]
MNSILMRTGSMPVQTRFIHGGSSRNVTMTTTTIARHNSAESLQSYGGERFAGKISIEIKPKTTVGLRRVLSESDVIISERTSKSVVGSKPSPTAKIPEEDEIGFSDDWGSSIPAKEDEGFFSDDGGSGYIGGGRNDGGDGGGGNDDKFKIGDYYKEMLKSDPNNSLLLMNYGKYLYEVEKDGKRAQEYYGRAILENPCDGEALSMYGKLIWETQRDDKRAQAYFDQALIASPHDCMVLGSYAHFMWEAEDDEEDGEEEEDLMVAVSPAMVSAV